MRGGDKVWYVDGAAVMQAVVVGVGGSGPSNYKILDLLAGKDKAKHVDVPNVRDRVGAGPYWCEEMDQIVTANHTTWQTPTPTTSAASAGPARKRRSKKAGAARVPEQDQQE